MQRTTRNSEQPVTEQPSKLQFATRFPSTHRHTRKETSPVTDSVRSLRHNVENFVVVWLNASVDDQNEDIKESKSELQLIVNDIRIFTDVVSAVDWMKTVHNEKVVLVISGSFGETVVPAMENLVQIRTIYIFSSDKEKHEEWMGKYRKVKGVFTDIFQLCEVLEEHIRKSEYDSIGFDVVGKYGTPSSLNNNKQEASFMYAQLFKERLLKTDDASKEELVEFCRQQYIENSYELEIINEFNREYHQSQVIQWYTRETFLYKMINKALRIQDYSTLYALRLFIRDLHRRLAYLQAISKPKSNKLTLFRGQCMSKNDFEKLYMNCGGLLSMNTFLSTSEIKETALGFAQESLGNPDTEAVLFQIDVDPMEVFNAPYANIDDFSIYREIQKEYLFSIGTVFRIGLVKKIKDSIWCVQLILMKENDKQLEEITKHMRRQFQGQNIHGNFGKLKKQAEDFYDLAAHEEIDSINDAHELHELGTVHTRSGHLDEALECFEKALEIKRKHVPEDDPSLAVDYNNIGYIYQDKKKLDLALECYQQALKIDLANSASNKQHIAHRYNNIGTVLDDQNKLDEALDYYERALAIRLEHVSSIHLDIAASYNNIGYLYEKQGKREKTLDMHEKSLTQKLASLPPNDPMIALSHSNIAVSLGDLGRYEEALEHGLKSLHILKNEFGAEHLQTQNAQQFVDELRQKMAHIK